MPKRLKKDLQEPKEDPKEDVEKDPKEDLEKAEEDLEKIAKKLIYKNRQLLKITKNDIPHTVIAKTLCSNSYWVAYHSIRNPLLWPGARTRWINNGNPDTWDSDVAFIRKWHGQKTDIFTEHLILVREARYGLSRESMIEADNLLQKMMKSD